jgi:hypothetical protein
MLTFVVNSGGLSWSIDYNKSCGIVKFLYRIRTVKLGGHLCSEDVSKFLEASGYLSYLNRLGSEATQ